MSSNKTIKKTVDIDAPASKVWEVLQQDELTRSWYAEFSEGTFVDTDWREGSKAIFVDNSRSGLIAKVMTSRPNQQLILEFQGVVDNGKEDYDSDLAKSVKGGQEGYTLTETGTGTQLDISCDTDEKHFETMSQAWDKALRKIKELAESR